MTERPEDLEASLADIDRKLRDLQAELRVVAASPPPPAAPDRVAELARRIDDLERLGLELEDATRGLQAELARGDSSIAPGP